jgi:hypothetical protein
MVFLDTTIATKDDLYFIKFLKVLPRLFSDLAFIVGPAADGAIARDHFFKSHFDSFANCLFDKGEIMTYQNFIEDLPKRPDK